MSYCIKCGKETEQGASFCRGCGAAIQESSPHQQTPGKNSAPKPDASYGESAPGKQEFDEKVKLYEKAEKLKRYELIKLIAPVAIFAVFLILLLSNTLSFGNQMFFQSLSLKTLFELVFLFLIAALLISFFTGRARLLKKLNLTAAQAKQIIQEYKKLPKNFLLPIPPSQTAASGPQNGFVQQPAKKKSKGPIIGLVVFLVAAVVVGGFMFSYAFGDSGGDSSGSSGTLNGIWVQANGGTTKNGMYTQGDAILFRDGKAYMGTIGETAEEIYNNTYGDRTSTSKGGVPFTLSSDRIILHNANGTTTQWQLSGNTIYANGEKFVPQ